MEPQSDSEGMAGSSNDTPTGFALGTVALIWMGVLVGPMLVASAAAGAIWGLGVGVIVGVACLGALLTVAVLIRRSPPRRMQTPGSTAGDATEVWSRRAEVDRGSRLLIAAGEAASRPEDLPAGVRSLIDAADTILVMAPALPGRLDWLVTSSENTRQQADERLGVVMGHLQEMGADAQGEVGADDPLLAFEDAIRQFAPDHLLVGLRADDRRRWQERGLLDQIQQRFAVPTTVFQFDE